MKPELKQNHSLESNISNTFSFKNFNPIFCVAWKTFLCGEEQGTATVEKVYGHMGTLVLVLDCV